MTPVNRSGKAERTSRPPSPGAHCKYPHNSSHTSSPSASTGLGGAYHAGDGRYVDGTRVVEVRKRINIDKHKDDPPAYFLVGPKGPIARVDQNKHGLGDDDSKFAKLLCDTMIESQPALRENTYLTADVLTLIAMNCIRDVRALNIPHEDQPREIIHRLKEPMVQAIKEAKAKELEHADNESVTLTANPNASLETSHQEANSEETDSSEETTAGFIIDIWWSALREANKKAVKNLARAPDTSNSVHKHQKATSDLMASSTLPTGAGTCQKLTCDANGKPLASGPAPINSITPAASKRSYLSNVWRDTTNDKEASGATSPAPEYPRVPFTPIAYDPRAFPMLRPIQQFTDAQIQAIKGATAEVKKKEGSKTQNGK